MKKILAFTMLLLLAFTSSQLDVKANNKNNIEQSKVEVEYLELIQNSKGEIVQKNVLSKADFESKVKEHKMKDSMIKKLSVDIDTDLTNIEFNNDLVQYSPMSYTSSEIFCSVYDTLCVMLLLQDIHLRIKIH